METKKTAKQLFLNGFWLKIIAILTMTFDHVGVALDMYYSGIPAIDTMVTIFRYIGRLALPLFCFMVVEGVLHTRSFKKYVLSLGIIGLAVLIAQLVMHYVMKLYVNQGNIFIDLILGAIAVKCLMNKKVWVKLLSILPLLYGVISFIFYCLEFSHNPIHVYFPYFFRAQYFWYSIAMIILFYISYIVVKWLFNNTSSFTGLDYEMAKDSTLYRFVVNSVSVLFLVVSTLLLYVLSFNIPSHSVFWDPSLQNFAIISGALLLFYNGKRGYNSVAFKYACYFYYPIHILLAYVIVYLTFII